MRYWPLVQIKNKFNGNIGPSTVTPEAFGGLGLLADDWWFASGKAKVLIVVSIILKKTARIIKPLIRLADSVYVVSVKA